MPENLLKRFDISLFEVEVSAIYTISNLFKRNNNTRVCRKYFVLRFIAFLISILLRNKSSINCVIVRFFCFHSLFTRNENVSCNSNAGHIFGLVLLLASKTFLWIITRNAKVAIFCQSENRSSTCSLYKNITILKSCRYMNSYFLWQ